MNNAQRVGGTTFSYQHAHPHSGGTTFTYQHAPAAQIASQAVASRVQHQVSQIPYVPHQPPSYGEHSVFDSSNR